MKIDLGDNFIFELTKGEYKDMSLQDAMVKAAFIGLASEYRNHLEDEKLERQMRALQDLQ